MTASEVKALLLTLAEPGYQEFFAGLIPGAKNIMGVKTSHLHRIAKKIAKEDWRAYLAEPEGTMYEEGLLRGLVIGYAKA